MRAVVQAFWLPKDGNALEEYEDAYWPLEAPPRELNLLRLAVADGATETSFSGAWADLLARAYCRGKLLPASLSDGLPRLAQAWTRHVGKKPLPWYAEQKREQGAFAAVVGLELQQGGRAWNGFAVGDCCLFQTRGESILTRFPLETAEQFDNRPLLLSSTTRSNKAALESVKTVKGTWQAGDTFYLMSDALSAWFLRHASLPDTNPVQYVKSLTTQAEFADFITLQRRDRMADGKPMMRNDDVTLLGCTVT
jgi:hypothetical protein